MTDKKPETLFVVNSSNIWKILTIVFAFALLFVLLRGSGDCTSAEEDVVDPEPVVEEPTEPVEAVGTFSVKSDAEICTEDGKPVVYLFSTTWCPHCKWITETFESTVQEYIDAGQIVAYHWEIDINDDTLSDVVETEVPQEHLAIYQEFNPRGSIPTFVFGCKYYRIGNGYERSGSLDDEEAEFKQVIDSLLEEV